MHWAEHTENALREGKAEREEMEASPTSLQSPIGGPGLAFQLLLVPPAPHVLPANEMWGNAQ